MILVNNLLFYQLGIYFNYIIIEFIVGNIIKHYDSNKNKLVCRLSNFLKYILVQYYICILSLLNSDNLSPLTRIFFCGKSIDLSIILLIAHAVTIKLSVSIYYIIINFKFFCDKARF